MSEGTERKEKRDEVNAKLSSCKKNQAREKEDQVAI